MEIIISDDGFSFVWISSYSDMEKRESLLTDTMTQHCGNSRYVGISHHIKDVLFE